MTHSSQSATQGRVWRRWAWFAGLGAVMAVGFWGYTTPHMQLAWDALLALCGY